MASLFDWSPTAGSNGTVDGVNIAEGCAGANLNNGLRAVMSLIRQSFSSTLQNFLAGSAALPVASGGTGSATAADARTALAAAKNGANGDITSFTSLTALGYAAGVGGTVTQATSKGTDVTLNKICGRVTTSSSALGAGIATAFTVNNSTVEENDTVICHVKSGPASPGAYRVEVCRVGAGFFSIVIQNTSGGSLSEALVLNFSVLKAAAA